MPDAVLLEPALRAKTDPARFEVVKNALYSAAEEMKIVLAKTAYSPLLKVAGDYSCGIFDATGNMVAQGPDLPIHLGSMPDAVRAVIAAFPKVDPGDAFIHNDPYHGGSHLPDVNVVAPAFLGDRLLGFGCVRAHWPDIGSATPGSYGAVTEIYGEGLRLPPVRLYRNGQPNPDIERIIFANVRTPAERQGDLRAQVAANRRGAQRLEALARKYGVEELLRIMDEVLDYSERMMRAALSRLPDGEASFTDVFDGDGVLAPGAEADEPFTVKLTLRKCGDEIIADFTGSDGQVAGPMNAPLTVTASGVYCALKMIADPKSQIPPNSGCWRPVTVTAPAGSVVNAQPPAPVVYANHEISHRVADMVMGAMFQICPDNVMAASQGTSAVVTFGGVDPRNGERYVSYESLKGGFGARPVKDGVNAVASTISNMMNTPIEMLEMSFPLRVEEYSLIPDSGGAGRWRGGLGARRVWRVLGHEAHAAVCCERSLTPPFGLAGGLPGGAMRLWLELPDGSKRPLNSKGAFRVPPEGRLVMEAPGSGGYGPPFARDPAMVCDDLADGYVTRAAPSQQQAERDRKPSPSKAEIVEAVRTALLACTNTFEQIANGYSSLSLWAADRMPESWILATVMGEVARLGLAAFPEVRARHDFEYCDSGGEGWKAPQDLIRLGAKIDLLVGENSRVKERMRVRAALELKGPKSAWPDLIKDIRRLEALARTMFFGSGSSAHLWLCLSAALYRGHLKGD